MTLKQALENGEFVVTCEMIPGRGAFEESLEKEFSHAKEIFATGRVHAISITDNPSGNPALLADAAAAELAKEGIESLTHFTCKDRSRNQIQSQLYALERQGLSNILVMTGDYQTSGWQGKGRPVFDLDPIHTLKLTQQMNEGLSSNGPNRKHVEKKTHFFAGAVVNPFKYTEGETITQYLKLERKILAGAKFIITQLGYDVRKMHELALYVKQQGYTTPLIANIFLVTKGAAKLMQQGIIAGCHISDEFMNVLEKESTAEDKGRNKRIERAAQMIAVAKGLGYAGVHIGGFGLNAELVNEILNQAEALADTWTSLIAQTSYGPRKGYYLFSPAEKELISNTARLSPQTEIVKDRKIYKRYRLSRFFHYWVLTQGKRGYNILEKVMNWREHKKGMHRSHLLEHISKTVLYNCIDCGDCGLEPCVYSCPMSACPKCQRNGPCGGSQNGWCEVFIGKRYCIHYMAYHRLKRYNEVDKMTSYITPPNDWSFFETSGWANYTHLRDNTAKRIPISIGISSEKDASQKKNPD